MFYVLRIILNGSFAMLRFIYITFLFRAAYFFLAVNVFNIGEF